MNGRRAVGVRTADGVEVETGEVIVSAGAIHSPAILLRSGIGVDDGLPVGDNLKDHPTARFDLTLAPAGRKTSIEDSVVRSVLRYSSGLADAGPNDMQISAFDAVGADDVGLGRGQVFGAVMRVYSHGKVSLRSASPDDDPVVEFNMLADERDLIRLRDAVRRIHAIVTHPAVASITETVAAPIEHLDTDMAIDTWLRANVNDYVHAAGSCRMGPPTDPAAVVDLRCRVVGYDGLRVCDASVMPDLPKANTHLTTVAVAERLATLMGSG